VKATILTVPTAPTITAGSSCGPGTVTLQAAGATTGQYRWYNVPTGGTAEAGETNSSFITPALTSTTTYYVSINNGSCESVRTAIDASIFAPPAKPTITASEPVTGGVIQLCLKAITLTAPAGFTYMWSSGQTTQTITIVQPGNFSVVIKDGNGCSSVSSDALPVVLNTACINNPPAISTTSLITTIGGSVSIDLTSYISDPDDNLDPASLQVVGNKTQAGGKTTLSGFNLDLNYTGVNFSGTDLFTIRICDLLNVCIEKEFAIEVIGDINVYNGISPNGDGKNDTWIIEYIDLFPNTENNQVTIYNRWGDVVWEGSDYDNTSVVFTGLNKNSSELSTGTYFYKIEFDEVKGVKKETVTGYLSLKR
jgi:gliding motility-associated-like protein